MKKFIAYYEQDGGCDYTIACGKRLGDVFKAVDIQDAVRRFEINFMTQIGDELILDYYLDVGWFERITIYEISGDMMEVDVDGLKKKIEAKAEEAGNQKQDAKERAEFERLKQKFEK